MMSLLVGTGLGLSLALAWTVEVHRQVPSLQVSGASIFPLLPHLSLTAQCFLLVHSDVDCLCLRLSLGNDGDGDYSGKTFPFAGSDGAGKSTGKSFTRCNKLWCRIRVLPSLSGWTMYIGPLFNCSLTWYTVSSSYDLNFPGPRRSPRLWTSTRSPGNSQSFHMPIIVLLSSGTSLAAVFRGNIVSFFHSCCPLLCMSSWGCDFPLCSQSK